MDKKRIINEIIKVQKSKLNKEFTRVANKEDLEKLTIGELSHILFISENVSQD